MAIPESLLVFCLPLTVSSQSKAHLLKTVETISIHLNFDITEQCFVE